MDQGRQPVAGTDPARRVDVDPVTVGAPVVPPSAERKGFAAWLWAWAKRTIESIDPGLTPRFVLGSFGGLMLGVIALVIVVRSESAMDPIDVRLAGPRSSGASAPSAADLRIAVGSAWALNDRFEHYDALAGYLGEHLGRPVVLVQRRTGGEIHELLESGDVQAAVVCTGTFLHAREHDLVLEALVVPVFDRTPTFRSVVVVRRASALHSMRDLRGRSFALTDPTSLAGYYDPLYALLEEGEVPGGFFSRTVFTYDAADSLRAVRNGSVDAAALDEHALAREVSRSTSFREDLRVVRRSPPYAVGPLVVPAGASDELRAEMTEAWVHMHESREGRAVLRALHIERFVVPPPDLYDSAAAVVARVEAHTARALP